MKKKIVAMCATVAIAALAVGGTLAYFTDVEEATNTFTVGNVDITLTEPSWEALKENPQAKVIAPNKSIAKDPTVTVEAGSEECFVRLLVTVDEIAKFKAAFPGNEADGVFLLENFVSDWNPAEWKFVDCVEADGKATYEFRYADAVAKSTTDTVLKPLFTKINIPATATNADLEKLPEIPTINIVAQAIQKEGFTNAGEAWAAFNGSHYDAPAQQ